MSFKIELAFGTYKIHEKTAKSPLFTIFLVVFMTLGFGIVIPILPYYAKTFGASGFELGLLLAIYSVMQFIFSPIWGRLSDHIGRRKVILISVLGTALAFFILGNAKSYFWLFLGRMFAGLASANISTASAYIADITTPENRAKGMGLIGAGFGLGFIFPSHGGVLTQYGYGMPMFFAGTTTHRFCFVYVSLKDVETPNIQEKGRLHVACERFSLR